MSGEISLIISLVNPSLDVNFERLCIVSTGGLNVLIICFDLFKEQLHLLKLVVIGAVVE
jgi:hypothetical protein